MLTSRLKARLDDLLPAEAESPLGPMLFVRLRLRSSASVAERERARSCGGRSEAERDVVREGFLRECLRLWEMEDVLSSSDKRAVGEDERPGEPKSVSESPEKGECGKTLLRRRVQRSGSTFENLWRSCQCGNCVCDTFHARWLHYILAKGLSPVTLISNLVIPTLQDRSFERVHKLPHGKLVHERFQSFLQRWSSRLRHIASTTPLFRW